MDVKREMAGLASGPGRPECDPAIWAETARRYERCHPGDTFADLARRSSFSKEDRLLMEDWLAAIGAGRG